MSQHIVSRFVRVTERENVVAALHQLHPDILYLRKDVWEFVEQNGFCESPALLRELILRKLLIVEASEDAAELTAYREQTARFLSRPSLYLMLAQGCNNACNYCPIPALAARHGKNLLSFDNAVAGIKLWQKHIDDWGSDDNPFALIFYGGEPLLNREVLERLLPYIAEKKIVGEISPMIEMYIVTNGRLIDDSLARMFAAHNVLVVVGCDGPPEYNDATRLTDDDKPTSAEIERAVGILLENNVRVAASATLTPQNVHAAEEIRMYLHHIGITHFGFNLLKGAALQSALRTMSSETYYRLAAQAVVAKYEGIADEDQEYQLHRKLMSLAGAKPFGVDCPCYGSQLVIQADGAITNCPFLRVEAEQIESAPDTFRIWNAPAVQTWRTRIPWLLGDEQASTSLFLNGGGCAWGSQEYSGSVRHRDVGNQVFNEEVMHELIWRRLPRQAREQLLAADIAYWSYRRLGHSNAPGT